LPAWLNRVADNVVRNARRDRRRRNRAERAAVDGGWSEEVGDVDHVGQVELRAALAAALTTLPSEEREAVERHFLGGQTYAEIADLARCSISAVAGRISRGLERLRPRLRRSGLASAPVALLTLAAGSGTAATPSALMTMLCELPSATWTDPATAGLVARANRWSKTGWNPMYRYTATAACALLVVAAGIHLLGSDSADVVTPTITSPAPISVGTHANESKPTGEGTKSNNGSPDSVRSKRLSTFWADFPLRCVRVWQKYPIGCCDPGLRKSSNKP